MESRRKLANVKCQGLSKSKLLKLIGRSAFRTDRCSAAGAPATWFQGQVAGSQDLVQVSGPGVLLERDKLLQLFTCPVLEFSNNSFSPCTAALAGGNPALLICVRNIHKSTFVSHSGHDAEVTPLRFMELRSRSDN